MKIYTFIYDVAGFEFPAQEAFGKEWKEAKAYAAERHAAIYRDVYKRGIWDAREMYCGGCFIRVDMAEAHWVTIF